MAKYIAPEMDITLVDAADIILASTIDKGDEGETVLPGVSGRG